MALAELVNEIKSVFAKRTEDAETRFKRYVSDLASGKPADPAQVADVLRELGRGPEALEAAVAALVRRRELAAVVAAEGPAERAKRAAEEAMRKLDAAHQAAVEKYEAARRPHEDTVQAWHRASDAADRARAELFKSCDDPLLLARRDELVRELEAANERIAGARDYRDRMQTAANQAALAKGIDYSEAIERARSRLPGAEQAVTDAIAKRDELQREMDEVVTKMGSV